MTCSSFIDIFCHLKQTYSILKVATHHKTLEGRFLTVYFLMV